ncbi:MAG: hypothetical protein IJH60_05615, partial [Eubacterium sp.]|nr:hypothetical protein [Eubacterium sp.]
MAKVAYVVNDALGQVCKQLGIGGYTEIDGHYTFSNYDATKDEVEAYLWNLLDDEDESNDDDAYDIMEILDSTNYTVMYYSTES